MVNARDNSDHKHYDSTLNLATNPFFTNHSVLYHANNEKLRSTTKYRKN